MATPCSQPVNSAAGSSLSDVNIRHLDVNTGGLLLLSNGLPRDQKTCRIRAEKGVSTESPREATGQALATPDKTKEQADHTTADLTRQSASAGTL